MTPDQIDDLRRVYLHTFDAFSTDPSEIADQFKINVRYVRELLTTLTNLGLVAEQDVNGDEIVWQVVEPGTYDDHSRDEAIATFERIIAQAEGLWSTGSTEEAPRPSASPKENKKMSTTTAIVKAQDSSATLPMCRCGCGAQVQSRKSLYRPGHDARHAGLVAREAATKTKADALGMIDALPSAALQAKSRAMYERLVNKATAPVRTKPTGDIVKGTVKVGRWTKIARKMTDGSIYFEAKKGESFREATDPKVIATFTPDA